LTFVQEHWMREWDNDAERKDASTAPCHLHASALEDWRLTSLRTALHFCCVTCHSNGKGRWVMLAMFISRRGDSHSSNVRYVRSTT
jgi:hypothetical protein